MKHTKKRAAALLLALAMIMSLLPVAFADDDAGFPDMPAEDEASYAAVKSAIDNELLKGEDGMLNLEASITRATMAALVTRVFGAKGEADLSVYPDVDGHWAVNSGELPAAVAMGIMNGSNGQMRPDDKVTMQEVITMLVRALGLEVDPNATLEGVEGADSVAGWAVPYVAALVKAGYISDVTGAAEPMTRVEFTEMIYKVSGEGNYVKEAAEITEDVDGNIIITADGVSLKGITVGGDVIVADGVDAGSIVLDGVTIKGRLVVRGGAETSLTNGTTATETVVAKTTGEVTVKADASSKAGGIAVTGTDNGTDSKVADKVVIDMAEPNVTVSAATSVAVENAEGGEVLLAVSGASVSVESGTVANVTVADGAENVAVEVAAGATIEKVTTNTDLAITGEGTVEEKEGSGTVTDAEGNEVAGSDEPADVPSVPGTSTTPAEEPLPDELKPIAHTHTWGDPKPFDATRHVMVCEAASGQADDGDEDEDEDAPCGATTYAAHSFDAETGLCVCGEKKPGTVKTEGTASAAAEGKTLCGADGAEHDAHKWVAKAKDSDTTATCAAEGKKSYECEYCGATKTDTIEKLAHSYKTNSSVPASCDKDGVIQYVCTNCAEGTDGHTKNVKIPATGNHSWKLDSSASEAATCQKDGKSVYVCTTCTGGDPATKEVAIAKDESAHDWSGAWEEGENGCEKTCANEGCSEKQTKAHVKTNYTGNAEGDKKPYKAATCKEDGQTATVVCRDCGAVITESKTISKDTVAHNYATAWSSDKTNHYHECRICGDKTDEAAHDGDTCKVCGYKAETSQPVTPPAPNPDPQPDPPEVDEGNT